MLGEIRLCGNQFQGGCFALWALEALHVRGVGPGGVFGGERLIGGVIEPHAADAKRANSKLTVVNPSAPKRLGKKSAIPARGLVIPGTNDNAVTHDDYPDVDEPVVSRTDGQVLGRREPGENARR